MLVDLTVFTAYEGFQYHKKQNQSKIDRWRIDVKLLSEGSKKVASREENAGYGLRPHHGAVFDPRLV